MPCRVTSPLFGDSAHGSVQGLITFRTRGGTAFAVRRSPGPPTPPASGATIRGCFATAIEAWTSQPRGWHTYKGHYRYMRWPAWPDFWRQWLIDHPDCLS